MKCIKNDLGENLDYIYIEIFSDLHIGSRKCNYGEINSRIEKVANDENSYCVLLGDIINNSTKTSVGDVFEEELSPMDQIRMAATMFMPIKDKILGVTSGNHERRSYKNDGTDLIYFLCSELGIADKYDYTSCLLFTKFGKKRGSGSLRTSKSGETVHKKILYTIYMTHGDGNGGRTVGGKANGLERRGQIVNSDIVITGHTHMPMTFRSASFEIDRPNCCIIEKEQVFVNASATLDYEAYAELYGLKPNSLASPRVLLDGHHHKVSVKL